MKKLFFTLSLLLLITCSKDSTEGNSSVYVAPPTNTTNPTTTPTVTQYTLSVTAGSGGSVSTAGGTYNDGTSISITATPSEGYGFVGWNGSDSTSSTISSYFISKYNNRSFIWATSTAYTSRDSL